ncbi:hypothetical protein PFISCL1PPCAC_28136, partial [Pristionchus fissidentatus]
NVSVVVAPTNTTAADQISPFDYMFYFGCATTGGVLNFIVLYIAFRYIDMEDKPRQIIVVNMTFADFLFSVFYMGSRPLLEHFPGWSCHAYYVTIWAIQLCSCFNLLWLNLDKLIFIQWPLHYYQIINRNRVTILSAVTWTSIIAICLVVDFFMIEQTCTVMRINISAYYPILFVYVILIICSFICSAIIYFIAQTTTKMEAVARSKMLRRLLFLFTSTLWTFFTCLPYRVLYLIASLGAFSYFLGYSWFPTYFRVTSFFLSVLSFGICFNPIITIVTQHIYRNRVIGMWKRFINRSGKDDFEISDRRKSTQAFLESIPLSPRN